jgi:hypothetical protein
MALDTEFECSFLDSPGDFSRAGFGMTVRSLRLLLEVLV